MSLNKLNAISPIDGRYSTKTASLSPYFSEYGLIKYRVLVEIQYFIALNELNLLSFPPLSQDEKDQLRSIVDHFSEQEAQSIKDTEKVTNHDVKAVEYFVKDKLDDLGLSKYKEWVHFGLTSQDINNTALPLMIKDALSQEIKPMIQKVIQLIEQLALDYKDIPMLAKTHGQPASPTILGKEMMVYVERISSQMDLLNVLPIKAKFGGATGNFNAHKVSFPKQNWPSFANDLINSLGLQRMHYTTQIAHYDHLAAIFQNLARINTILVDFCRDIWTYISMEYFKQKTIANEVGSSAMPHKVNPIDFENAEGNLMYANALLNFLAEKLPISRLQRDLTDSTVSRNVGVPLAHMLIAFTSIQKGISKLQLNEGAIDKDLEDNWAVIAEAIQNILRREGVEKPYEKLKALTRGQQGINKQTIRAFVEQLDISDEIKEEIQKITPHNYVGYGVR